MHYAEKVVVVRRTAEPFVRIADIEGAILGLLRAVPTDRRKGHAVLVDTRAAPMRPDPSLEPGFGRYRSEVERGFERVVVVVTSVVGRIRSDRLGRVSQIPLVVTGSIDEAWVLLRAP
jgi:hypothetical protein